MSILVIHSPFDRDIFSWRRVLDSRKCLQRAQRSCFGAEITTLANKFDSPSFEYFECFTIRCELLAIDQKALGELQRLSYWKETGTGISED